LKVAKDYFGRFTETPLIIPSAMLALMSTTIEESIDTLRIASAAISQNKLSLGAVENLSLAAKLLVQSAVAMRVLQAKEAPAATPEMPVPAQIPPAPELRVAPSVGYGYVPPPLLFMPYYPFYPYYPYFWISPFWAMHRWSWHRAAIGDYRFHPVHTHYIYG
jgi:hypothetical protein